MTAGWQLCYPLYTQRGHPGLFCWAPGGKNLRNFLMLLQWAWHPIGKEGRRDISIHTQVWTAPRVQPSWQGGPEVWKCCWNWIVREELAMPASVTIAEIHSGTSDTSTALLAYIWRGVERNQFPPWLEISEAYVTGKQKHSPSPQCISQFPGWGQPVHSSLHKIKIHIPVMKWDHFSPKMHVQHVLCRDNLIVCRHTLIKS